ncbi:hypothetical protein [Comamonas sp.]|uniref:hypothetical protein n=1 Tax=Comamonas sp. TaxID=34028 RepID=UPI00289D4B12|nr:hypothetical protein [Comamonas sp.]
MSNRTFACLDCRKLQRRDQNLAHFYCPICAKECVCVPWKLHVPSPRKLRKWNAFWAQYFLEMRQLEAFRANKNIAEVYLPLLNKRWGRQVDRSAMQ